jgi:hypothetical protein
MYQDGDLIFSIEKKKFGKLDIIGAGEFVKDHPSYPGCENMIRIQWEEPSQINIHWSSLYWQSTFDVKIHIGILLVLPSTITEQEKLALLIKYT